MAGPRPQHKSSRMIAYHHRLRALAAVFAAAVLLAGCATIERLPAVPFAQAAHTKILDISDARFDVTDTKRITAIAAKAYERRDKFRPMGAPLYFLAISGGGDDGAFGARLLSGSSIGLGAQTVCAEGPGAFTGEVAAGMIADIGCSHVLVGHSERRVLYGEDDALVARKFAAALQYAVDHPEGVRALILSDSTTRGDDAPSGEVPYMLRGDAGLEVAYLAMDARPDLTPVLPALHVPALVIYGEQDEFIGRGIRRVIDGLPNRHVVCLRHNAIRNR